MAYFNHAFTKVFLGIGQTLGASPTTDKGFITESGFPMGAANAATPALSNLVPGYFGFFDPKSYECIGGTFSPTLPPCCPVVLASSSILANDKIGPFHGGYRETNKSKVINPKYVQAAYKVTACVPQQAVVSIGVTPQTLAPTVPDDFQSGTTSAMCQHDFLCGETYYLRIDVKGSPALRALNHNAYQTLSAYTGCCSGPTPEAVDPTLVYIQWASALIINNYLKPFVLPVVFDTTGTAWYAPGTTVDPLDNITPVLPGNWWTAYVSPALPSYAGLNAGMRLLGAYVETKFLNCSFQITDFFEKEPVRIYASLVDYNGDPCVFERLCVYNDCRGIQGMGFGEQVVRDLILSQSYLQNFFHTDIRIREITQGNQMLDAGGLSRNALYTRYFILHSVPRFNNPTGVFDNDRYMLEIIASEADPANPIGIPTLDTFLTNWLNACANCVEFTTPPSCDSCAVLPNVAPIIP